MDLMNASLQTALALLLLGAGVVTDLRSKKVPNQIIIAGAVVAIIFMVATQGFSGVMLAGLSLLTAAVAIMPLYLMRVLGGGDVKLMLAASLLMDWKAVLISIFAAMIWGSVLGIVQVILKGQGKAFAHNMLALANRAKLSESTVHKIPFTVALLLGYLSSLVYAGVL
jgi:prepilin peptidase CpaA